MGALTNVVKRYVPATYRAMIGPSEYTDYYSLSDLQELADYVQFKLLATVAGATEESSTYDRTTLEFLGKVTTLKFLPAAIDYWMDQQEQVQLSGHNETESFASRLNHLREVQHELAAEVAAEAGFVIPGSKASLTPDVSYGDGGRGVLLTPDPQLWPGPKRGPAGPLLPWGF